MNNTKKENFLAVIAVDGNENKVVRELLEEMYLQIADTEAKIEIENVGEKFFNYVVTKVEVTSFLQKKEYKRKVDPKRFTHRIIVTYMTPHKYLKDCVYEKIKDFLQEIQMKRIREGMPFIYCIPEKKKYPYDIVMIFEKEERIEELNSLPKKEIELFPVRKMYYNGRLR